MEFPNQIIGWIMLNLSLFAASFDVFKRRVDFGTLFRSRVWSCFSWLWGSARVGALRGGSVVWKSCCFARNMKQRRSTIDPYDEADNDSPYKLWATNAWPFQNNWKCHFSQYQVPARLSIWLTHPKSIKLTWSILKCFLLFQWVSINL